MKKINLLIICVFVFTLIALQLPFAEQAQAETQGNTVEISGLADKTLTQMRGQTVDSTTPVTQTDEGYRLSFHSWNRTVGDKAIVFKQAIDRASLEASGGLTLRMYVHLSQQSPYLVKGGDYGIFLYGYGNGITGAADDGYVDLPQDVKQDEWINFNITVASAKNLFDADGNIRGLQYGARIEAGNGTAQFFYLGEPSANKTYIVIQSISLREKGEDTLQEDIYVATAAEGEEPTTDNEAWGGALTQVNGIAKGNVGWEEFYNRPIRVYDDGEAINGRSYAFNFHSWYGTSSNNVLPFNRPVSLDETSGGLLIRIKAHLSPRSPYYTSLGGIRLMALDATGKEGEGYMIPGDITQDTWITLRLTPSDASRLANADGKIYGLQIGSVMRVGSNEINTLYIGESAAYIKIDYIALCSEKTLTYHNYDGEGGEYRIPVITGLDAENYYYIPAQRNGMFFVGWYEGENVSEFGELFDFSENLVQDIHLTARWITLAQDLSEYYGVYLKGDLRVELTENGLKVTGNDFTYESAGVGTDGVLYLVSAYRLQTIDLSELKKERYFTATFYCFGSAVETVTLAESEACTAIDYRPAGYRVEKWCASSDCTESMPAYTFGSLLSENISLYAYCTRLESSSQVYPDYYGLYYNTEDKSILELCAYHSAQLTEADGTKTSMIYYLLEDDAIVFENRGVETRGRILPLRLTIGDRELIRLTSYSVRFESEGVELSNVTVSGNGYTVAVPAAPERDGYVFSGWYTERQGGRLFDFDDVIYRNTTVYAHWQPVTSGSESGEQSKGTGCKKNSASSGASATLIAVAAVPFVLRRKR